METMFINLDARRITVCGRKLDQKACGAQETVCYTVLSRRREPPRTGKVLDFEACRRALERGAGEAARMELSAAEEMELSAAEKAEAPRRRPDPALIVEIGVSLGVLALVAAVAVRFFLG